MHRSQWFFVLLSLAVTFPAEAVSADSTTSGHRANAVRVSTGLLALPRAHSSRIAVVAAFPDAPAYQLRIRYRDTDGAVLGDFSGFVGGGASMVASIDRASIDRDSVSSAVPLLVRAELVLRPATTAALPQSCPLLLTLQTVEGDTDDGAVLGCGIDPCLDLQPNPPPRTSVFANCISQRLTIRP